jgi:hypothetical protein
LPEAVNIRLIVRKFDVINAQSLHMLPMIRRASLCLLMSGRSQIVCPAAPLFGRMLIMRPGLLQRICTALFFRHARRVRKCVFDIG